MRRPVYIGILLAAVLGSFFVTLWRLDDGGNDPVDSTDARSDSERLASQRVTDYSELRRLADKAGLKLSMNMIGIIDGYSRLNARDVAVSGWVADPEGDANPLNVMVFISGSVAAKLQTKGERADVTRDKGLGFGTEKNVIFEVNFTCSAGTQPVVVALGMKRQYFPLMLPPCP
jgi:hypothetical protein